MSEGERNWRDVEPNKFILETLANIRGRMEGLIARLEKSETELGLHCLKHCEVTRQSARDIEVYLDGYNNGVRSVALVGMRTVPSGELTDGPTKPGHVAEAAVDVDVGGDKA